MLPCMCDLSLSWQVLDLVLETSGMSSAELPLVVDGLEIVCWHHTVAYCPCRLMACFF